MSCPRLRCPALRPLCSRGPHRRHPDRHVWLRHRAASFLWSGSRSPAPLACVESLTPLPTPAGVCFARAGPRPEKPNSPDGSEAGASRGAAPSGRPPLASHEWTFCLRITDSSRSYRRPPSSGRVHTLHALADNVRGSRLQPPASARPPAGSWAWSLCTQRTLDEDSAHGARGSFSSHHAAECLASTYLPLCSSQVCLSAKLSGPRGARPPLL